MSAELWDREQIRDYLGLNTINSVYPWLSRHKVRPVDIQFSELGRVRYYYDADMIRSVAASLPRTAKRRGKPRASPKG